MSEQTTEIAEAEEEIVEEREERFHEIAHHPEELPLLPGEVRPHPQPRQYVLIAVILVVITALEVGASYLDGDVNDTLLVAVLLALAAVKFFLVASWYMHLRTDLKLFRVMFATGLVVAGTIYFIVLLAFGRVLVSA
jgi:cytochrome c oxidase subunit 4